MYEVFYCSIEPKCDSVLWIEAIIDVSHLLLAINSSCNVVIYTFSRKQFQENISDLIQRRKSKSLKKTLYFYICMTSHHIIREEKDQTKYLPSQTIIEEICRSKVVKWVSWYWVGDLPFFPDLLRHMLISSITIPLANT